MNRKNWLSREFLTAILLILCTLIVESLLFGRIFWEPNQCIFMDNADGRQIYFNIAYHVKYGHSYVLSNQNYPFYENIFMTDAQASVAMLLNWVNHHLFSLENYTIGIVNGFILYTIPLCSLFLFLIFRHLRMEKWVSFVFALSICFLSPQILRITCGHYGLSYLFYFPALIYFLLRLRDENSRKWLWSSLIVLLVFFFGFNNGHMSLAGSLFLFLFGAGNYWQQRKHKNLGKYLPFMLSILCLSLFALVIKGLDQVTDRELYPWGFLFYHAQLESIFLPAFGMLYDFFNVISPVPIAAIREEGASYIGFVGSGIFLFMLWRMFAFVLKNKSIKRLKPVLDHRVNLLLFVGFMTLLYAMAFPFRFGFEFLLDSIPFIRQFRAPGRFAWIFYYTFSIYVAYITNLLVRRWHQKRRPFLVYAFLILCLSFYAVDSYELNRWNFRYINKAQYFDNVFRPGRVPSEVLRQFSIDTAHYSSIYGIPVCNAWNSKFERKFEENDIVRKLIDLSYETSIPWINSKLSRVSTSQTLWSGQVVSHPVIERELFQRIDQNKHVLVVVFKPYERTYGENYLLGKSRWLFSDSLYAYYDFTVNNDFYSFRDSLRANFDQLSAANYHEQQDAIAKNLLVTAIDQPGNSVITVSPEHDKILLDNLLLGSPADSMMEVSIWALIDNRNDNMPFVVLHRKTSDGILIEEKKMWVNEAYDYQHGMIRYEYRYKLTPVQERIELSLPKGKGHSFSRLMIKPVSINVFERKGQHLYYNNYRLR